MSIVISEIARVFVDDCSGAPARARYLLDVPFAHLLDGGLVFAITRDGTPAEQNYLDVMTAWLHATPVRRGTLEGTLAAVRLRLQAIAEAA